MTVKKINPGEFVGEKDGFSKEIYIVIQGSVLFKTKQACSEFFTHFFLPPFYYQGAVLL